MKGATPVRFARHIAAPLCRVWNDLVKTFADMAARDPQRMLARLEAPPMVPDARHNPKWIEADLHYRQVVQQLQKEIQEAQQRSAAPWWAIARAVFSNEGIGAIFTFFFFYFILSAFGLIEPLVDEIVNLLIYGWNALWN
jgi:hypothetical protein